MTQVRWRAWAVIALLAGGCATPDGTSGHRPGGPGGLAALKVVVMDPLADRLACDCVAGFAQRRYPKLCEFLSARLGRPVEHFHTENLADAIKAAGGSVDLIIGKRSVIEADAAETGTAVRPIAMLTDKAGRTDLVGLFVVRSDSPIKTVAELKGKRILFGPKEAAEKHAAALDALSAAGAAARPPLATRNTCSLAAVEVIEKKADAAVVSGYAMALLEGCSVIAKGELRVVGQTQPVPFVTVFATGQVAASLEAEVLRALGAVKTDARLLVEMESAGGFVPTGGPRGPRGEPTTRPDDEAGWPGWRGPNRDGISRFVPHRLPENAVFLWRRPLTGPGLSGVAVAAGRVIVADKDEAGERDIWRCLNADTGEPLWQVSYPAAGEMDYTNSPRATPVIHQGLVYLLGAFGELRCVRLANGEAVWRRNIMEDFRGERTQWGVCATPLVVGDKLIVNPGGKTASLVALDRLSGREIWRSPGGPAAYASFILARLGGVEQIVGYDAVSLGGWDVATGKRLWELLPAEQGDFNVPTPIVVGDRLLVTTENNGTRLYGFDKQGSIRPEPLAVNRELAPDTSTPAVLGNLVFGCWNRLYCLDAADGLRKRWEGRDAAFADYAALIGGNDRVLIVSINGELVLVAAKADRYEAVGRLRLFDYEADVYSHPALVAGRLYVRSHKEVVCVRLDG